MHFSIPETNELTDSKGTAYTGYCVHINGVYHCMVRYRQLFTLHEQLKREFIAATLPTFPPKKLFPLSNVQIEERRLSLEKYLQLISQDPRISNSQTFNTFLLSAQQETRRERTENVSLDVFLMNEHRISVNCLTIEQSDAILERVCANLSVPEELVYCFSLFLIRRDSDGDITIVRKLQDFESPYISQKALMGVQNTNEADVEPSSGPLKVVLRKSSWDPSIDDRLLSDPSTLNLLYIQTVADIERGWVLTSSETKQQLALMQARGVKRQFMEVARSLKYYGYMVFRAAITDHPEPHTRVTVALGRSSLNMRLYTPAGEIREAVFKVTRMRCWRIMTTCTARGESREPHHDSNKLELSFEYLVTADRLEWVTIVSSQAILMSLCLQSMVEELVRLRGGGGGRELRRAGRLTATAAPEMTSSSSNGGSPPGDDVSCTSIDYTVKKLAERFAVVNMRATSRAAEDVFVENEAFSQITDENL